MSQLALPGQISTACRAQQQPHNRLRRQMSTFLSVQIYSDSQIKQQFAHSPRRAFDRRLAVDISSIVVAIEQQNP